MSAEGVTLTITDGDDTLRATDDYTVAYAYVAATETVKAYYTATIEGAGDYTGEVVRYYTNTWSADEPDSTSWPV